MAESGKVNLLANNAGNRIGRGHEAPGRLEKTRRETTVNRWSRSHPRWRYGDGSYRRAHPSTRRDTRRVREPLHLRRVRSRGLSPAVALRCRTRRVSTPLQMPAGGGTGWGGIVEDRGSPPNPSPQGGGESAQCLPRWVSDASSNAGCATVGLGRGAQSPEAHPALHFQVPHLPVLAVLPSDAEGAAFVDPLAAAVASAKPCVGIGDDTRIVGHAMMGITCVCGGGHRCSRGGNQHRGEQGKEQSARHRKTPKNET